MWVFHIHFKLFQIFSLKITFWKFIQKNQRQFNLQVEINKNEDFVIQRLAHFNKIALGKLFFHIIVKIVNNSTPFKLWWLVFLCICDQDTHNQHSITSHSKTTMQMMKPINNTTNVFHMWRTSSVSCLKNKMYTSKSKLNLLLVFSTEYKWKAWDKVSMK